MREAGKRATRGGRGTSRVGRFAPVSGAARTRRPGTRSLGSSTRSPARPSVPPMCRSRPTPICGARSLCSSRAFWLAHVAAVRRDHRAVRPRRRGRRRLPAATTRSPHGCPIDVAAIARDLGSSASLPTHRRLVRPRLRHGLPARVRTRDGAPRRFAEDLVIFTGEEFRFFELSDEVATRSSLMPQKKNPVRWNRGRKVRRMIARHAGSLATMKGLPSGYNRTSRRTRSRCSTRRPRLAGAWRRWKGGRGTDARCGAHPPVGVGAPAGH